MSTLAQVTSLVREDDRQRRNLDATIRGLLFWLFLSVGCLGLYAVGKSIAAATAAAAVTSFLETFATGAFVGAAGLAVGALLGFLFGIPRTVQLQANAAPVPSGDAGDRVYRQEVNTNLEQISDWLTKILVGVGLTQLGVIPDKLWQLANAYAELGGPAIALALILNFSIAGFFCGYLLTRLFLAGAFAVAAEPLRQQTEKAKELEKEGKWAKALDAYESLLGKVTPTTPKAQKRQVYEGAMYNALYQNPPEGFEKAIKYGTEFIREEPGAAPARMWAYLAAAFGQQYRYRLEQKPPPPPESLAESRAKALESVKAALQTDPQVKELLRLMWDPASPIKSPEDNDLEVFFEDPEFRALLAA